MEKNSMNETWYVHEQLNFDRTLITFRYRSIKPFFHGSNVLELGVGSGVMTNALRTDFQHVRSVDGSLKLLSKIPNHPKHTKVHSYFETYTPADVFDTIIMECILEHVDDPIALLIKVKNWLAPGGVVIIGVPNANSLHRQVALKMGLIENISELNERDYKVGHQRVYTPDTFKNDILEAGLNINYFSGRFLKPLSNQQINETWSNEMIEGFYEVGKNYPDICAEIFAVCTLLQYKGA